MDEEEEGEKKQEVGEKRGEKEGEEKEGRGSELRGWRRSTCPRPARCSETRWRVDGEATAAERPSCSLGRLPIKAGTLLSTRRDDEATANPTDSERERERRHLKYHPAPKSRNVTRRNKK